jgi:hypothetical protein
MSHIFLDRWMKKNPGRSPDRFVAYNFSLFYFTLMFAVLFIYLIYETSFRSLFIQGLQVFCAFIFLLALILQWFAERNQKRIISQFGASVKIPVPVNELDWTDRWVLWNIVFGMVTGISIPWGFAVARSVMHFNLIFSVIWTIAMAYGMREMAVLIVEAGSKLSFCRRVLKYHATTYRTASVGRTPQAKRANPPRNAGNLSAPATSDSQLSRSGWSRWMRRGQKAGPKPDPKSKPTSGPNSES